MEIVQLNSNAKLSKHFTLGEFTKSNSHPEVYNIPSHEAIANMKRLCVWLEALREASPDPSKGRVGGFFFYYISKRMLNCSFFIQDFSTFAF